MRLAKACRDLHRALSKHNTVTVNTYWYAPDKFNVSDLKSRNSLAGNNAIKQAEAQGLIDIVSNESKNFSSPQNAFKTWFLMLNHALSKILHLSR